VGRPRPRNDRLSRSALAIRSRGFYTLSRNFGVNRRLRAYIIILIWEATCLLEFLSIPSPTKYGMYWLC
jgi:hypothetical protein